MIAASEITCDLALLEKVVEVQFRDVDAYLLTGGFSHRALLPARAAGPDKARAITSPGSHAEDRAAHDRGIGAQQRSGEQRGARGAALNALHFPLSNDLTK